MRKGLKLESHQIGTWTFLFVLVARFFAELYHWRIAWEEWMLNCEQVLTWRVSLIGRRRRLGWWCWLLWGWGWSFLT